MVRLPLSRQLREWAEKKWGQIKTQKASARETSLSAETFTDEEKLGFLDYVEFGNDNLERATTSLSRIEDAIADVEDKTTESTPKLASAIKQGDVAKQKQVLNIVTRALEEFGLRVDTELRIFSNSYWAGIDAVSKSVILWKANLKSDYKRPIQRVRDSLESLLAEIDTTREAMVSMKQTVSALPQFTANSNRAKKHTDRSFIDLNRAVSSAHNLTTETLRELKRIVGDRREPTMDELLPFMHADTRQAYLGDISFKQREEIRKAEVARWKETNCRDAEH